MTKRDLRFLLTDLEIFQFKETTETEASLKDPQMIYHINEEVYEWEESELTHEDIVEALLAKQTKNISTIKNICFFFAIVLCISMLLGLLGAFTIYF